MMTWTRASGSVCVQPCRHAVYQYAGRILQYRHGGLLSCRMGNLGQSPQREFQKSDGHAGQPADRKIARDAASLDRLPRHDLQFLHGQDSGLDGDSDGSGLCGARNSTSCAAPSVLRSNLADCGSTVQPSRRSYSSTALSRTCAPAAHCSKLVHSASLWEIPPRLGTKIIVVGATRAM